MPGRTMKSAGVLGILVLLVTACAPYFAGGSVVTFTALGPLVTVSWPAAVEDDDGQEVASYTIEVNGTPIATPVAAPATSCVLIGLAASTTYTISVTARDTADEWSGSIGGEVADLGRISGAYTTPAGAGGGATLGCVPTTDTDGDRLPNAVETNTGTYLSAGSTGSNPNVVDTDADGIRDGDEVLGTTAGLNLPAMGTKPTKRNILLEFDWFNDNAEPGVCASHSHQPTATAISKVVASFASSPVTNPDGTTGVAVISDYGQGGAFTGGNLIADADGVIAGGVSDADFAAAKAANFAANRNGYFHYVLNPHRYGTSSNSSGQAEINGDDLIVSLYCYGSDQNVANTIVHELGHNLGLRHGGNVDTNFKPNYNSVMNYQYQFPGVDTNCTVAGDGVLNYSVGTRATLNEAALIETNGICGGVDVDWNGNAFIDAGAVVVDINQDASSTGVHSDHNDWAAINYGGITDGDGASARTTPELINEQPVPLDARD